MKGNSILFAKSKKSAIIPSKKAENGGYDIYACFDEEYMSLKPHETTMIPTGIHSAFSSDYVGIIKERGSTGSKGIKVSCGVIDSGYRGEWFVALYNSTDSTIQISKQVDEYSKKMFPKYPYSKAIAQIVFVPVPKLKAHEISLEELKKLSSERGLGKLGSSGK